MITTMPIAMAYPRPGLLSDVTAELPADLDGHDVDGAAVSWYAVAWAPNAFPNSRIVAPRIEGGQDRQGHVPPVLDGLAPMFSAASRQSLRRPSMAGAMIRTMSGNWKYM